MRVLVFTTSIGILFGCASVAEAACPDQAAVDAFVADFAAARPSKGFGNDISLADAECARGKVAQALPKVLGPLVGYKAAFTNPALQERFKVSAPSYIAARPVNNELAVALGQFYGRLGEY